MPDPNPVSLTIDPKTVESIIHAQIQAAIVANFAKAPDLISRLVDGVMTKHVDPNSGNEPRYGGGVPLIHYLSTKVLSESAEMALRQWVNENKPQILAAIRKRLQEQKGEIVKKFVEAAERSMSPNFHVSCSLTMNQH